MAIRWLTLICQLWPKFPRPEIAKVHIVYSDTERVPTTLIFTFLMPERRDSSICESIIVYQQTLVWKGTTTTLDHEAFAPSTTYTRRHIACGQKSKKGKEPQANLVSHAFLEVSRQSLRLSGYASMASTIYLLTTSRLGRTFVHLQVGSGRLAAHEDVFCRSVYFKQRFQCARKDIIGDCTGRC